MNPGFHATAESPGTPGRAARLYGQRTCRDSRYTRPGTGCSAVWLARRVWVAEVAGSNPASPTTREPGQPDHAQPDHAQPDHAQPYTASRSPVPSTPSSARTASVTGPSVSSSGSCGASASAEPVAAASLTARSASHSCRTVASATWPAARPGHRGEPSVPVGHRPDGEPGRAAEHRRAADPLHPVQVRSARVGHRAEQPARRGQHAQRSPPGRVRRRQRHADRQRRAGHLRPRHRRPPRPHHLGQPGGYDHGSKGPHGRGNAHSCPPHIVLF
jgi:hypothetical protein